MRLCALIVMLFLASTSYSQEDSTYFSEQEILNIDNYILDLEQKDSLNIVLTTELKKQLSLMETLHGQDSLSLVLKQQEVDMREIQNPKNAKSATSQKTLGK